MIKRMSAAWIYLAVAVLVEVTWGLSLKAAAVMELGKWFCGVTVGLSLLSMWLLILVMRDLPAGLAYGIWTCLGTIGITLAGWLKRSRSGRSFFWRSVSRGLWASSSHRHRNVPFSQNFPQEARGLSPGRNGGNSVTAYLFCPRESRSQRVSDARYSHRHGSHRQRTSEKRLIIKAL